MISFVAEINFSEFAYACFNRCISSSICGKDISISTKKSTLNSYSNPQSTLARLHFSDGSKRLLAEWWQIEMQKTALLAHCLSICLEVQNEITQTVLLTCLWSRSVTTFALFRFNEDT